MKGKPLLRFGMGQPVLIGKLATAGNLGDHLAHLLGNAER